MLEVSVQKALGNFTLDANLSCQTSGIIAVFGRSGAGKTSLINCLAGLLTPDQGRIDLNGATLFDSASRVDLAPNRRRIGYVFQEGRLFPHLSVRANLLYGFKSVPPDERRIGLDQVVDLLGISALLPRRPGRLSGGEKQRVALGRALLANPKLLLMDEPLAALDQPRKDEILPFIERLRDDLNLPIVYVSHAMDELVRLADTMVLLSDGAVKAVGPIEELTTRLDLRPLTGRHEAGAVIDVKVAGQDKVFGLTDLVFPGGRLQVPRIELPLGSELRVRIRARDVALALEAPQNTSFLNVLKGEISNLDEEAGALVDVLVTVGGVSLWSRITARSRERLRLTQGTTVHVLIKAVAVDRHALGRAGRGARFMTEDSKR